MLLYGAVNVFLCLCRVELNFLCAYALMRTDCVVLLPRSTSVFIGIVPPAALYLDSQFLWRNHGIVIQWPRCGLGFQDIQGGR